jgi:uncharacterized MAPEG superfamily protein
MSSQQQEEQEQLFTIAMDPEVFRVLVACTSILISKMLLTNFYSAIPSALGGFAPPEDSWIWKSVFGVEEQTHGIMATAGTKDKPAAQKSKDLVRAQRVIMNDLENIPISLIALWMAGAACKKGDSAAQVIWLTQLFTAARLAHTASYFMGITLLRSVVFAVGYVSVFRAVYLSWSSV